MLSTAIVEHVKCNGADDGSASVSISGGLGPYSLNWQGVDSSALSAGTYAVIIKDANNCIDTIDVEINQPAPVEADFDVNQMPFELQQTVVHNRIHTNGCIMVIINLVV